MLKQCLLGLISNLLLEDELRKMVATDMSGLLSCCVALFKKDIKEKRFDWLQSVVREFNVFINAAQEKSGQEHLTKMGLIEDCKFCLNNLMPDENQREIFARSVHLFSKLARHAPAAE